MESELTKKVLNRKTEDDLKKLVNEIGLHVYNYIRKRLAWDEDKCSEFFCYFYPRIEKLITNFKYSGKDFEAYLNTCIRLQSKTFINRYRKNIQNQKIFENPDFWNIKEADIIYNFCNPEKHELGRKNISLQQRDKNRLIYFILKESTNINSFNISDISEITNIDENRIHELLSKSTELLQQKISKLENLKKVRNKYYFKIFKLQEDLDTEIFESGKSAITDKLTETREKLRKTIRNMSAIKMSPTNREIAKMLGIPKGTVDSGIYYLKRNLMN